MAWFSLGPGGMDYMYWREFISSSSGSLCTCRHHVSRVVPFPPREHEWTCSEDLLDKWTEKQIHFQMLNKKQHSSDNIIYTSGCNVERLMEGLPLYVNITPQGSLSNYNRPKPHMTPAAKPAQKCEPQWRKSDFRGSPDIKISSEVSFPESRFQRYSKLRPIFVKGWMNLHYPSRACQNMFTALYQKRSNIVSVRAVLTALLGKLYNFWGKFSLWFLRYAFQADLRILISTDCLSEWLLSKTMSVISA